jgi:hypothetical protein
MLDPQSYLQVWQMFTGWHVGAGCRIGFALGEIRPISVALTAIRSAAASSIHEWNVGWAEMDLFDDGIRHGLTKRARLTWVKCSARRRNCEGGDDRGDEER